MQNDKKLQNLLKEKLENCDAIEILKSMGYASGKEGLKQSPQVYLNKLLDSECLGLDIPYFDFKYDSTGFIKKLC